MLKKELLENEYIEFSKTDDRKMVFGDGNPDAGILFIGEAPGGDEIKQGKPFVGKAGKNLDGFMSSINMDRTKCYISNAVKFRPTKTSPAGNIVNATPTWKDIQDFRKLLAKEIAIIKPKLIVTLGGTPTKSILNSEHLRMGGLHGKFVPVSEFQSILFVLYHPAAVIYNASLNEEYKKDLETLKAYLKIEGHIK